MFYMKEKLLTLHEHLCSLQVFCWVRVANLFIFLCCVVFLCFVCLTSCVLCVKCCQCLWIVYSWLSLRFFSSLTHSYVRCTRTKESQFVSSLCLYCLFLLSIYPKASLDVGSLGSSKQWIICVVGGLGDRMVN